jgi:hypothetical protein
MSENKDHGYGAPVDRLLTLGEAFRRNEWPDVDTLGIGPEHVPELIRMALDDELYWADSEATEVWAPIHARRALGLLRAQDAIVPFLQLLEEDDSDWPTEELPDVYAMIGPAAIPALTRYMADEFHDSWPRIIASLCLCSIGEQHPSARGQCIDALTKQLKRFGENEPEFNGFLVSRLVDLKARKAAKVIREAFEADRVDTTIMGDWEDARFYLGLGKPKTKPKQSEPETDDYNAKADDFSTADNDRIRSQQLAKQKARSRRKQAKKQKRKSRKHK